MGQGCDVSTHRVGWGESVQRRRGKPGTVVRRHVAESAVFLPIGTRLPDFIGGARNEVPPHEHRLRKQCAPDEKHTGSGAGRKRQLLPLRAQVVQHALGEDLSVQVAVAAEHKKRVFMMGLDGNRHGIGLVYLKIGANDLREVFGR